MALDDIVKCYDDLRTDLDAAFPMVIQSILVSLVESETITRSTEGKCRQMLQKRTDAVSKKVNAEQKSRMDKLQKELSQKSKVNGISIRVLLFCFNILLLNFLVACLIIDMHFWQHSISYYF